MRKHSAERPLQLHRIRTDRMAAAFAVRKGDHTVDVRRQRLVVEALRDQFRGVRRAVTGRDHGDVVARPDAAVLARIAEEGRHFRGRFGVGDFARWEFVVERQLFERQIVRVNVRARLDDATRTADCLAVAPHDLARRDRLQRHLVTGGDGVADSDADTVDAQIAALHERHAGYRDIIGGVQMNRRILGGGQFSDFE